MSLRPQLNRILPAFCSLYLFLLLIACLGSPATAQEAKNVLVLYGNTAELPWVKIFDASLRSSVTGKTSHRVEFYTEYFDVARFREAKHRQAFLDLVRARYADRKIDVIVLGGTTAFDFIMSQREKILPHVPFVFSFLSPDRVEAPRFPRDVVGVPVDFGPMPTIELALRLHPGTKRLVLVTGAGPWDRAWEKRLRQETSALKERMELEFLAGLPPRQLLERLSTLPKDTVVFTPGYFNDGTGAAVIPREVVEAMATKSTAPVYVAYDTYVGTGAVGGVIPTFDAIGRQTGQIVAALLEGKSPAALQLPSVLRGEPLVDWRQVRRWGINESRLPSGTVVRFKLPSIWEQYRWYIIGALAIFAVQALLIVGLLLHRARRRRAEAQLRESQEFMELSTNAGELGLWVRNLEHGDLWANPRLRSLFGFGENDVLRFEDIIGRIHPDDRTPVVAELMSKQEVGASFEGEFRVLSPDGSERWVAARGRTGDEPSRHGVRRMGVVLDITERKRAEERSREVLEAAPNAMIVVSREGKISLVNTAVETVFGYPRDQLIGCPIEMLLPERVRDHHLDHRQGYFADPEKRAVGAGRDIFGRRKDGSEVPIEIGLTPIHTPQGLFTLASIIDITARKEAELETQRHRDELAHVSRVSMMGQLASALAHELNQPLGAILRNAEAAELFLQASPPDLQEVRAILVDIRKDDQRAGEVIDRMRALLKRRECQWSELDFNTLAEEAAGLLRFDAEARRVKLTLELSRSVPVVRGDRVQLQQVLLNLILNAMDAMNGCEAAKRCVAVCVRHVGAEVEVAVSDTGHGIPEENFKCLFEPFFTTKPSGMGMGLAISRTIIEAHGGRLWAENNPEGGATFRFTLPVAGRVEQRGTGERLGASSDE